MDESRAFISMARQTTMRAIQRRLDVIPGERVRVSVIVKVLGG
jgi:hypothetical protein